MIEVAVAPTEPQAGPSSRRARSPSPTCNSDLGSSHASFILHVKILYLVPLPILIFALHPSPLSRVSCSVSVKTLSWSRRTPPFESA